MDTSPASTCAGYQPASGSAFRCRHHGQMYRHNTEVSYFYCGCDGTTHLACRARLAAAGTPQPEDWPVFLSWRTSHLLRVSVPRRPTATFGLISDGFAIVEAAPIARWTVGRMEREIIRYWERRGAIVEQLDRAGR